MPETSLQYAIWAPQTSGTPAAGTTNSFTDGPARLKQLSFVNGFDRRFVLIAFHDCTAISDISSGNRKLKLTIGGALSFVTANIGSIVIPIPGNGIRFEKGMMAHAPLESYAGFNTIVDIVSILFES